MNQCTGLGRINFSKCTPNGPNTLTRASLVSIAAPWANQQQFIQRHFISFSEFLHFSLNFALNSTRTHLVDSGNQHVHLVRKIKGCPTTSVACRLHRQAVNKQPFSWGHFLSLSLLFIFCSTLHQPLIWRIRSILEISSCIMKPTQRLTMPSHWKRRINPRIMTAFPRKLVSHLQGWSQQPLFTPSTRASNFTQTLTPIRLTLPSPQKT